MEGNTMNNRIYLDEIIHAGMWVRELMRPDSAFSEHFIKVAAKESFHAANQYLRQQEKAQL